MADTRRRAMTYQTSVTSYFAFFADLSRKLEAEKRKGTYGVSLYNLPNPGNGGTTIPIEPIGFLIMHKKGVLTSLDGLEALSRAIAEVHQAIKAAKSLEDYLQFDLMLGDTVTADDRRFSFTSDAKFAMKLKDNPSTDSYHPAAEEPRTGFHRDVRKYLAEARKGLPLYHYYVNNLKDPELVRGAAKRTFDCAVNVPILLEAIADEKVAARVNSATGESRVALRLDALTRALGSYSELDRETREALVVASFLYGRNTEGAVDTFYGKGVVPTFERIVRTVNAAEYMVAEYIRKNQRTDLGFIVNVYTGEKTASF